MPASTTAMNRRTLYRSRKGVIFGVCQGVADYAELNVLWVRVAVILVFLFSGLFPMVLIYVVAAIAMKPEPVIPTDDITSWEFYNTYATDRVMAMARLRRHCEDLERRTHRIESALHAREDEWERRLQTNT